MRRMGFGSAGEMIFLFILALVVLGPKRLPELARQLGKFMNEFKRASNEFKYQIESEINNLELQEKRAKQQILPPAALPAEQTIAPPPAGTVASGSLAAVEVAPTASDASSSESMSSESTSSESTSAVTVSSGAAHEAVPAKGADA